MPAQTDNLFLFEDLEDVGRTGELPESDLDALHAVAEWIKTYVVKPHEDLGRAGPVCPFLSGYQRLFLDAQPTDGDDAGYRVIVIVFTDLSADRARVLFDEVLQHLALPSYAESGIVFGQFYDGHDGAAIYKSNFRPFRSPVPFMFVRNGVVDDWKFFLDNNDWLDLWARRFGGSGAHALAEELRRLPWRVAHD
jgi:Domain of unknown function (DUF6875)